MNMITQFPGIYELSETKERLKDDVMNPALKWYERMELYKEIQDINLRIKQLRLSDTSK